MAKKEAEKKNPNDNANDVHIATLKYSVEQFDKQTLFIASGALGVSFAFIKDIVPDLAKASSKYLLFNSWYIFTGVIFLSLVNHFLSAWAHRVGLFYANLKDDDYNKMMNKWNYPIRAINIIIIFGLLTGTIFLINFIRYNLNV